ncbi:MAG: argininosuccinate lyase [Chitinophagales bacterium]
MAKLWQKSNQLENELSKKVEKFTVGNDRILDSLLAKYDVLGSLAHTKMLNKVGLLSDEILVSVQQELKQIYKEIESGNFQLNDQSEDIHSDIEFRLSNGKAIHTGRSRNDQVLLDLKLYSREKIQYIVEQTKSLFDLLIQLSEKHKNNLLPGYTHLQLAMPSSFGLWFAAYAEGLTDDTENLYAAFKLVNKNPLGSGAGYGSSFPLDRKMTTALLGFDDLNYNVVYAQMNRGKMERVVLQALGNIAATLSKLAVDATLYLNQHFAFISFPDVLTTGSSIMPHKKNPDVFELIRAKCNKLQSLANQVNTITTNLPSGYHRDLQIIKEDYLLSFDTLMDCLEMMQIMMNNISVKENILEDDKYKYLFTVDSINQLTQEKQISFRDAYIEIGKQVEVGKYQKPKSIQHTLIGSIGNLSNVGIQNNMEKVVAQFPFQKIQQAIQELVKV